ncbi:hypothetical protein OUZ56_005637 [Daphnia magna]|uniref:Uncharacterized protein n=1 Tax=Daphnia magna TaxID=35525 RepID=A0ABQ9YTF0_9CRUS|nr:hypothetical protein OUZ56_005637 [Daphnia magna]
MADGQPLQTLNSNSIPKRQGTSACSSVSRNSANSPVTNYTFTAGKFLIVKLQKSVTLKLNLFQGEEEHGTITSDHLWLESILLMQKTIHFPFSQLQVLLLN